VQSVELFAFDMKARRQLYVLQEKRSASGFCIFSLDARGQKARFKCIVIQMV